AGGLADLASLGIQPPEGATRGTLFGFSTGVIFVLLTLLLYVFIRSALSGAIVFGLFGLIAMQAVGGLYPALFGLLAGSVLGTLFGAIKTEGGLLLGPDPYPVRTAFPHYWRSPIGTPPTPERPRDQTQAVATRRRHSA